MSTTADLITLLKAELKASGITYARLAQQLVKAVAEHAVIQPLGEGALVVAHRPLDAARLPVDDPHLGGRQLGVGLDADQRLLWPR